MRSLPEAPAWDCHCSSPSRQALGFLAGRLEPWLSPTRLQQPDRLYEAGKRIPDR